MATVYLAVQESLDRQVALKVMTPRLAVDVSYCNRFRKEGRITAQLNHPNLMTVYDTGVHENHYYMASEYLPGGTAREKMKAGMSEAEIVRIMREIASGLGYAHSKGFVHRDVKPGNLLFKSDGACVLCDFGIAKAVDSNTGATKIGTSIGTPHYMSPEQAKGEKVDHRTDIYSLGVLFYELLTGKPPFDADDPFSVALMQINDAVPKLSGDPAKFQGLIERLMEKDRDQRYGTAEEFVTGLDQLMSGGAPTPAPAPAKAPREEPTVKTDAAAPAAKGKARSPSSGSGSLLVKVVIALTVLVLIGGGGFVAWKQFGDRLDTADGQPAEADSGDAPKGVNAYAADLEAARKHVEAGRLVSPPGRNALGLYRRILEQDPDNEAARAGLADLAGKIEQSAEIAWAAGELEQAEELLDAGLRAFPGNTALEYLQSQVEDQLASSSGSSGSASSGAVPSTTSGTASSAPSGRLAELIRLGDKYYDANIFSHPPGENATDIYLQVLEIEPTNERARARLNQIADTWAAAAETNLRRGKIQIAQRMIEKGLQASPEHAKLNTLAERAANEGG